MRKLKVREYTHFTGISLYRLRRLEMRGKIHPIRSSAGYRYYDENALYEAASLNFVPKEEVDKLILQRR